MVGGVPPPMNVVFASAAANVMLPVPVLITRKKYVLPVVGLLRLASKPFRPPGVAGKVTDRPPPPGAKFRNWFRSCEAVNVTLVLLDAVVAVPAVKLSADPFASITLKKCLDFSL